MMMMMMMMRWWWDDDDDGDDDDGGDDDDTDDDGDDDDDDHHHVKILGLQFGKLSKATHWHRIFVHVSWLRIKIPSPPGKLQIETMAFAWALQWIFIYSFRGSGGPFFRPPSKAKGSPGSSRKPRKQRTNEWWGTPKAGWFISWQILWKIMEHPLKKIDDLALPPWLGKPPCGHLLVNKHVAVECLLMDSKGHDWEIANSQILTENTHAFHVQGESCLKCFFYTSWDNH